ncbi:adenylate cyclase type 10-like [Achroia grisella]|uniref:adenylate cyclase type 10-like n=1 Tax=Achroia grisella TaxID=688607 RepID=UPI0027D2DAEF|nr:adenylate cyclase type 10-like [Achroia grisella]
MMAYPMRTTCDKETFLRSKLAQEYFRLVEQKYLKGIPKPGPIYEFNKFGWPERLNGWRHPLLGRNEELRKYKMTIQNAVNQQNQKFTRYGDHKYAIAFIGPSMVGKTRLLEECLHITPHYIHKEKIVLTEENKVNFGGQQKIMSKGFHNWNLRSDRENFENMIRYSMDTASLKPVQIHAINVIFDCRFPLPEQFSYDGDFLKNYSVRQLLIDFFKYNFTNLWVAAILEAQYTDDESWCMLLLILESKMIFILMSITNEKQLSEVARNCLKSNMIVNMRLNGIDRWYHAALACQLLDVQAIPADLVKIIESASGGMPGWIQNFVISLIQRGVLTVVTVPRAEAVESGAIIPSPTLLQRSEADINIQPDLFPNRSSYQSMYSILSMSVVSRLDDSQHTVHDGDTLQLAVLAESNCFDDLKTDISMDAVILKTYDSLTPFEKMLLKCGSVLGEVFSRRMLLHLLQSDSNRKVAQAVSKLFSIRVLECEGGDFTRDTSPVLVHPAPTMPDAKHPYCACLGIRSPPDCQDLPMYAFCGYMKFRHTLFRTTTYELLTENQKHEMHARALLYLERYTRRCKGCGAGCFIKLLGLRSDDGLVVESEELKRTRAQICALSAEAKLSVEQSTLPLFMTDPTSLHEIQISNEQKQISSYDLLEPADRRNLNQYLLMHNNKLVRSFSSLEIGNCECMAILLAVYCQMIDHCRGADEYEKLYEAYMEYADLCVINLNIPQAIRLLFEVEEFIKSNQLNDKLEWVKDYRLANIYSLRGVCLLETGDMNEARKQLLYAMQLYCDPFPTSKHAVRFCDLRVSVNQVIALYILPNLFVARNSGFVGHFYENIAQTLNRLYRLFTESGEKANANLAAKWSLNYALRTNSNFRLLCFSYGNIIATYRQKQKFRICLKLKKRAMELCYRKRGLDAIEIHAVCHLYTNIFLFYVEYGKKLESLQFGFSVMQIMTNETDLNTRQVLILWMLKFLLSELRIHDMVSIMRDFFYMTGYYDLSSETWYYFYALVILLDTGYCVESYSTCEQFYIKKGDAILRSKTPEAAWNFLVAMWLITIRAGAWERSILWEDKIRASNMDKHDISIMILVRLVEGLIITLVNEMNNRNIKKILLLEKAIKSMFHDMNKACDHAPIYRPRVKLFYSFVARYFLLFAYYHVIRGKKQRGYSYLNKAIDLSKQAAHGTLLYWAEHTRNHWIGTLNPKFEHYWTEHIEPDNLLEYKDFDMETGKIIPYTLPLPSDLEK